MIAWFHRSLKTAQHAHLAVLIGSSICLWSILKEDTGFSFSKAVFGSPLTVPGEFLEGIEILPSRFLQKIEQAVSGFVVPPPYHVSQAQPAPLPPALLAAKFVFVREDASVPLLAPLYQDPYLILERRTTFFRLRLGDRIDVVSVERLNLPSQMNLSLLLFHLSMEALL